MLCKAVIIMIYLVNKPLLLFIKTDFISDDLYDLLVPMIYIEHGSSCYLKAHAGTKSSIKSL